MTSVRTGHTSEIDSGSREGGAVAVLDLSATVVTYTAPVPRLLGVADETAAVTAAVAELPVLYPAGGSCEIRGCTAVVGRLSNGGWTDRKSTRLNSSH